MRERRRIGVGSLERGRSCNDSIKVEREDAREREKIEGISKREEGFAKENKKNDVERKDGKKKGRVRDKKANEREN